MWMKHTICTCVYVCGIALSKEPKSRCYFIHHVICVSFFGIRQCNPNFVPFRKVWGRFWTYQQKWSKRGGVSTLSNYAYHIKSCFVTNHSFSEICPFFPGRRGAAIMWSLRFNAIVRNASASLSSPPVASVRDGDAQMCLVYGKKYRFGASWSFDVWL